MTSPLPTHATSEGLSWYMLVQVFMSQVEMV